MSGPKWTTSHSFSKRATTQGLRYFFWVFYFGIEISHPDERNHLPVTPRSNHQTSVHCIFGKLDPSSTALATFHGPFTMPSSCSVSERSETSVCDRVHLLLLTFRLIGHFKWKWNQNAGFDSCIRWISDTSNHHRLPTHLHPSIIEVELQWFTVDCQKVVFRTVLLGWTNSRLVCSCHLQQVRKVL